MLSKIITPVFYNSLKSSYRCLSNCPKSSEWKILVTRDMPKEAYQALEGKCKVETLDLSIDSVDAFKESLREKDALICTHCDNLDENVLSGCEQMKVISSASYKHDNIDLKQCQLKNIKVLTAPECFTESAAEYNIGLLITINRRLLLGRQSVLDGEWSTDLFWHSGRGLENSIVGIVGFGAVGLSTAKKLKAFKPKEIIYTTACGPKEYSTGGCDKLANYVHIDELLCKSDYIILSCSLNHSSKHLIDRIAFRKMKKTTVLINTSHADVIRQNDLISALLENRIGFAALDVSNPDPMPIGCPLLKMENCLVTPNLASATFNAQKLANVQAARSVIDVLEKRYVNSVVVDGCTKLKYE